jgi:hypothetical protein
MALCGFVNGVSRLLSRVFLVTRRLFVAQAGQCSVFGFGHASHPEGATIQALALASSPQLVLGARGVWKARTTVRNGAPSTFVEPAVLVWWKNGQWSKRMLGSSFSMY